MNQCLSFPLLTFASRSFVVIFIPFSRTPAFTTILVWAGGHLRSPLSIKTILSFCISSWSSSSASMSDMQNVILKCGSYQQLTSCMSQDVNLSTKISFDWLIDHISENQSFCTWKYTSIYPSIYTYIHIYILKFKMPPILKIRTEET